MTEYMVVIEQGVDGFGAYVPDLPGFQEAIAFHLELLREDGLPIPQPHSESEYVAVTA